MVLLAKLARSPYTKWLAAGLAIRFLLMPITVHADLLSLSFSSYFFAYAGILNIYEYLVSLSPTSDLARGLGTIIFVYPPLTYFTLGTFMFILKIFYPADYVPWLISNLDLIYQNPQLFRFASLFKLPYLIFDLALAFLLTTFFNNKKQKLLAFIFWIFNPLAVYASFMLGHFDIIPTFFAVLALFFVARGKSNLAALALGIGGSYKMFPLLFLPIVIFVMGKSFGDKLKLAILGILPTVLTFSPFINSPAFRSIVLFSPWAQKPLFMSWNLTGAEAVLPFVLFYSLIVLHSAFLGQNRLGNVWRYFFAILLVFFSVTSYHPQWFLWLTPFAIIEILKNNFKHLWLHLILFGVFFFILLMFESSLSYGLFASIFPQLAQGPSLAEFINRFYDVFQLKSGARSIFAAVSAWLIFDLLTFREKNLEKV